MKTLLALLIAAVAGGYYAATLLDRAFEARQTILADPVNGQPTDATALGLEALTGRLLERQLAELVAALPRQDATAPKDRTTPQPEEIEAPEPVSVAVRPAVVEAWTDAAGLVHCRLADGSEWLRLESGELVAVQPCKKP